MKHWLVAGTALAALAGCESPDTENELEEFRSEAPLEEGSGETEGCSDEPLPAASCVDARPNPQGAYLCALSATLGRDKPLYMELTFTTAGNTLVVESQPLVRDLDEDDETPMAAAREPAGPPLPVVQTTLNDDGTFIVDWPGITVVGDANPLTYRDLGGDLVLSGVFVNNDVAVGDMCGEVTNPTTVPLRGSTFACVRSSDPASVDPVYYNDDALVLTECNLPGEGSAEGALEGSGSE